MNYKHMPNAIFWLYQFSFYVQQREKKARRNCCLDSWAVISMCYSGVQKSLCQIEWISIKIPKGLFVSSSPSFKILYSFFCLECMSKLSASNRNLLCFSWTIFAPCLSIYFKKPRCFEICIMATKFNRRIEFRNQTTQLMRLTWARILLCSCIHGLNWCSNNLWMHHFTMFIEVETIFWLQN